MLYYFYEKAKVYYNSIAYIAFRVYANRSRGAYAFPLPDGVTVTIGVPIAGGGSFRFVLVGVYGAYHV